MFKERAIHATSEKTGVRSPGGVVVHTAGSSSTLGKETGVPGASAPSRQDISIISGFN